ncbi:STAS/SEC14 domain-containing protein [Pseudalkalibacillus caeni]|uniref:STAS/SEC14 domain-containing protein n=1 Tax=Exobacillus caeni TaxID=2574798 RepID=A0A5R9EZK7_9BACL|nr:STAS/SEC14 domain-containing protein [Pseudalkalibacillus caeni]TLS36772.1 STAS/SEC14 domain-containing protein [Pseudalkalibacillus caeni]
MIFLLPSRNKSTIAIEVSRSVTEEDSKFVENIVEERFGKNDPINALVIINELDGTSLSGMLKGIKFDIDHYDQSNKFAVVADKKWLEMSAKLSDLLPNIEVESFEPNELELAWGWLESK